MITKLNRVPWNFWWNLFSLNKIPTNIQKLSSICWFTKRAPTKFLGKCRYIHCINICIKTLPSQSLPIKSHKAGLVFQQPFGGSHHRSDRTRATFGRPSWFWLWCAIAVFFAKGVGGEREDTKCHIFFDKQWWLVGWEIKDACPSILNDSLLILWPSNLPRNTWHF